jgi:signal transduction histidine kinase
MIPAAPLPNEPERIAELLRHNLLDTPNEPEFDEIVQLAALICDAEIALISLVDDRRQWFKAKVGLDAVETSRDLAFCAHAIQGKDLFEVPNATEDIRFHDNPLVTADPNIRFYAGQPLHSVDGHRLGTLCVIDRCPRQLTPAQRFCLQVLAKQVERLLELRVRLEDLDDSLQLIQEQKQALEKINAMKDKTIGILSHDIRSPLASLQGVLDLFDQDVVNAQTACDLIQNLRPQFQNTQKLLESVLEWVKEQNRGNVVQWTDFCVDEVMTKSLAWVETSAKAKGVNLIHRGNPNLRIKSDAKIVELVLRNLLANAVKFTTKGDRITIQATATAEGKVRLGVQDTGVGISEADVKRILEETGSVSKLGTAREKGTGLGLMLCQSYLLQINSTLEITSSLQEGSSFSFVVEGLGVEGLSQ